eukprot:1139768-Pelagomonas_calceolata.AAC.1
MSFVGGSFVVLLASTHQPFPTPAPAVRRLPARKPVCIAQGLLCLALVLHRWYDPLKKETNLNAPAIKQWLSQGAQPSDTVKALLKKAYVIEVGVTSRCLPGMQLVAGQGSGGSVCVCVCVCVCVRLHIG